MPKDHSSATPGEQKPSEHSAQVRPATALPWFERRGTIRHEEGNYIADTCDFMDADYIVHACNAYPRLVAALRKCVSGMPHNPAQDDSIALLSDLGEI